jgi:hypothetical protein
VCGHGLAGPDGTRLAGRAIADGENEVHARRIDPGKLRPILAAQAVQRVVVAAQDLEGQGMHLALRLASGTVAPKPAATPALEDTLGQDAARRIACAIVGL